MLTIEQVAEYLKLDKMTIYRAVKEGKVKGVKFGAVWRISEEELERIKREGF